MSFSMKKRVLISFVITIFITILLRGFWLVTKDFPVSFDVKGKGSCAIEVLLNKKNDETFKNVDKLNRNINLDKEKHSVFKLKDVKSPKRLKIKISNIKIQENLSIGKIQLRYGKQELDNLCAFDIKGANYEVKNGSIILSPTASVIEMIYKYPLKIRAAVKLNFEFLVIISVLTFLLVYKLTDYIADFSSIKRQSRIDIIFLLIFFILLFIPMSDIEQGKTSKRENRNLATWQPFIKKDGNINLNFGKDYEKWFNDRFRFRKELTDMYKKIYFSLNFRNENGFCDVANNFMYVNYELKFYTNDAYVASFTELEKFKNWCDENNIKLYILIVPTKYSVYPSKKPYCLTYPLHDSNLKLFEEYKQSGRLNIIYPYKELSEAKKDNYMFFKTEHHWTDDGAFIGYNALMREVVKDFPDVEVLTKDVFSYSYNTNVRADFERIYNVFGTTCGALGFSEEMCRTYSNDEYRYYKHKDYKKLKEKVVDKKYHRNKNYHYEGGADPRVIVLGSSQSENLMEFIPFTFKNVLRLRNNDVKGVPLKDEYKIMKSYRQEILDYNPDIIVLCYTYWDVLRTIDFFNKE